MKNFKSVVDLTIHYQNLLKTLANLEIKNEINTKEYKNDADLVEAVLDYIIRDFKKLHLTYEEAVNYAKIYSEISGVFVDDSIPFTDIFNIDDPYLLSVFELINEYNLNNPYIDTDEIEQYFIKTDKNGNEILDSNALNEEKERLLKIIKAENDCILLRNNLIYNSIMDNLLIAIKEEKNPKTKEELIKLKYKYLLISYNLGYGFSMNNEKITRTTTLKKIVEIRSEQDEELYSELFTDELLFLIEDAIQKLTKLILENTNNQNNFEIKCYTIYIKSIISINYDLNNIKNINDIIKNNINLISYDENTQEILKSLLLSKKNNEHKKSKNLI